MKMALQYVDSIKPAYCNTTGLLICSSIICGNDDQAIVLIKKIHHRYLTSNIDKNGKSALHVAASSGKVKVLKWFLDKKIINVFNSNVSVLHLALYYGQIHCAVCLLKYGEKITSLDNHGNSPLDYILIDRPLNKCFNFTLPSQLYAWGRNANYNLGQTNEKLKPELTEAVRDSSSIINISMNKFHTLFLTSSGKVYSCGYGQGGRLGLDVSYPIINPKQIKGLSHVVVKQIACGIDHSLFLTGCGQVWSCGTNKYYQLGHNPPLDILPTPRVITWHKDHKEVIHGIAASHVHSVIWSLKNVFTFGFNGGQLGHSLNCMEKTVLEPRLVTALNISEDVDIVFVSVSNGATVISSSVGDVFILYQYQVRKVASRLPEILKISCVGGLLNPSPFEKIGSKVVFSLKVAMLLANGLLYIWDEDISSLKRCSFSLRKELIICDFCFNEQNLCLVTTNGEVFISIDTGKKVQNVKPEILAKKGQKVDFLKTLPTVDISLSKLSLLHRTIRVYCDPKGQNFFALQNDPRSFLKENVTVGSSKFQSDFKHLYYDANEMDLIHDIIIVTSDRIFPAHSYILSYYSDYFKNLCCNDSLRYSEKIYLNVNHHHVINLPDMCPTALQAVLEYIYCGSCRIPISFDAAPLISEKMNTSSKKTKLQRSTLNTILEGVKKSVQRFSQTVQFLEIQLLSEDLAALIENIKTLKIRTLNYLKIDMKRKVLFDRQQLSSLWDVNIQTLEGDILSAHKCILAARLEYFRAMFFTGWVESTTRKPLNFPMPTKILKIILDYLYEDEVPKLLSTHVDFVCSVLIYADQLLISRLKEICEQVLASKLNLKNATDLLVFSDNYNALQLKNVVLNFISVNLATFLELGNLNSLNGGLLDDLTVAYQSYVPDIVRRTSTFYDGLLSLEEVEQQISSFASHLSESEDDERSENVKNKEKKRRKSQSSDNQSQRSSCSSISEDDLPFSFESLSFDDLVERPAVETCCVVSSNTEQNNFSVVSDTEDWHHAGHKRKEVKRASCSVVSEVPTQQEKTKPSPKNSAKLSSPKKESFLPSLPTIADVIAHSLSERALKSQRRNSENEHIVPVSKNCFHKSSGTTDKVEKNVDNNLNSQNLGKSRHTQSDSVDNGRYWAAVASSPPGKNDGKIPVFVDCGHVPSFSDIIHEEGEAQKNLHKQKNKPLSFIQIEDKAIEELLEFYGAGVCCEEVITVERVQKPIAEPLWFHS